MASRKLVRKMREVAPAQEDVSSILLFGKPRSIMKASVTTKVAFVLTIVSALCWLVFDCLKIISYAAGGRT